MTDQTRYTIGYDSTGLGYSSMTLGVHRHGRNTPASREAAKREALRRWMKLGYRNLTSDRVRVERIR